jgi:hypothetical protein
LRDVRVVGQAGCAIAGVAISINGDNTSGLLCQYFPKGTDLTICPERYLDAVAGELKDRPKSIPKSLKLDEKSSASSTPSDTDTDSTGPFIKRGTV